MLASPFASVPHPTSGLALITEPLRACEGPAPTPQREATSAFAVRSRAGLGSGHERPRHFLSAAAASRQLRAGRGRRLRHGGGARAAGGSGGREGAVRAEPAASGRGTRFWGWRLRLGGASRAPRQTPGLGRVGKETAPLAPCARGVRHPLVPQRSCGCEGTRGNTERRDGRHGALPAGWQAVCSKSFQ